ncbi:hypothetical protein B0H10DRAFT_2094573 [Mycena sp. CBHHK59/15]|nr:hypothetical protein B0H10DRAFT_2094573 [Mycena sp. CBHHK59/15]
MSDRSTSRGRNALISSGRGGLGNIRPSSNSRDRPVDGPDDFSDTRGREPGVAVNEIRSTGRGGVGNFRSPSRDVDVRAETERDLIRAHEELDKNAVHSTGRGGFGNMSRSRSRGPSPLSPPLSPPPPQVHSSGRGGAGNIVAGSAPVDFERGRPHVVPNGIHSTGRGGLANLTSSHTPDIESPPHPAHEYESSGRGGAGNISRSRERGEDAEKEKHGIAGLWGRMHSPARAPQQPEGALGGVGVGGGGGGAGGAL